VHFFDADGLSTKTWLKLIFFLAQTDAATRGLFF